MRLISCLMFSLLLGAVGRAEVRYDMTKAELLKELGKPTATMSRPGSGREILNFPKGVSIELEKGVVVGVKGLDDAAVEAATKAHAAQKAEAEEAARLERETEEKIKAAQVAAEARTAKPETTGNKAVEKDREPSGRGFSLATVLIDLAVRWVLMVAVLKLAANYWAVRVNWSGLLLAATAATGVRAIIVVLGQSVLHVASLYLLDHVVAAAVLAFVLRKQSTNLMLNRAATIALIVQGIAIVVGAILIMLLLKTRR